MSTKNIENEHIKLSFNHIQSIYPGKSDQNRACLSQGKAKDLKTKKSVPVVFNLLYRIESLHIFSLNSEFSVNFDVQRISLKTNQVQFCAWLIFL